MQYLPERPTMDPLDVVTVSKTRDTEIRQMTSWASEECDVLPRLTKNVEGKQIEELVGPTNELNELLWLVKFRTKRRYNLVPAPLMNHYFPQRVIQFYQRRLFFPKPGTSMISQSQLKQKPVNGAGGTGKENNCNRKLWKKNWLNNPIGVHDGQLRKSSWRSKKPLKCHECGAFFRRADYLKCHVRVHSGEKPYKCKIPGCNKFFRCKTALNAHVPYHSEERPFICPLNNCGKAFKTKNNLRQHAATHPDESKKIMKLRDMNTQ